MALDLPVLLEELIRDEGLRRKLYKCPAGKWTIGIGRNLEDRGITGDEALYLARNDVAAVLAELDARLPWWRQLDGVRQRVLANMGFNMGVPVLLGFKLTLALVEAGNYAAAADAMLNSRWARQVGVRAQRLATMMRNGERSTT